MRVYSSLNTLPAFHQTVVTIGAYDGVHLGHQQILEQVIALAKSCEGESVVLTFEPHPRTVLYPDDPDFKLITTKDEKIALLEALGIDHVVLVPFNEAFSKQSAHEYVEQFLIRRFNPRYIVIGYDHRFGNNREGNMDFLKKYEKEKGFNVVEIPAQEIDNIAISSSKIRKALDAGDVKHANRLLGHTYTLSGLVVEGNRIGRSIGFPTANLQVLERYKLILPDGIYAARITLEEKRYDAMLYIGSRPSISGPEEKRIEVNLIDFEGDLYGEKLRVEVLDFIRGDMKLDSLEALQKQIENDKKAITKVLHQFDQAALVSSVETTPQENEVSNEDVPTDVDVAVVILNYNTRRHLETYLPSVVEHSRGARIIVADNGSPDDSLPFLRLHYPDIDVLDLRTNYGFAQGYNEALKQVKADVYVILNSDVEVASGWMKPVLEAMKADPMLAIAQPKILAWSQKERFEYAGASGGWIDRLGYPFCRGRIFSQLETDHGQYDTPQDCFWAAGAAFFIRADIYHQFGGFDGDYFAHNEEIDLCWRIKRAGYQVRCVPQSVVYHLGGGTLEYESPRKVFLNFRNSMYTLLKNESWSVLIWLLPARLILDALAGARFVAKGQFRSIFSIIEAHLSFYRHFSELLRKRKVVAQWVEKYRVGPETTEGMYRGSIVWTHYAQRIKTFNALFPKKA